MTEAVAIALLQAAPVIIEGVEKLIEAFDASSGGTALKTSEIAYFTVTGINAAHRDWDAAKKREWAFDAIRGRVDSDRDANALIEISLQRIEKEAAVRVTSSAMEEQNNG